MKTPIDAFLDDIQRQIQESRDKIISNNQARFNELVLKKLKKGDVLYVANGTSYLKREGKDNPSEAMERICDQINRGVWEVGFDFEYKTEI